MKIKPVSVKKGKRTYVREDGTFWSVICSDNLWGVFQVDENDDVICGDPRNGIEFDYCAEPRLSWALERIRNNN